MNLDKDHGLLPLIEEPLAACRWWGRSQISSGIISLKSYHAPVASPTFMHIKAALSRLCGLKNRVHGEECDGALREGLAGEKVSWD